MPRLSPASRFLTQDEKVFGYEILFRGRRGRLLPFQRSGSRPLEVRWTLRLLMGLDILSDGRRAFINCTRDMLLKDYMTLLPSSHAVVEILETVEPDDLVMAACQRLKAAGYMIALDDFTENDPRQPLTDFADILKVDVRNTTPEQRAAMVKNVTGPWKCRLPGREGRNPRRIPGPKKAGFLYFQGYFFRRPETMKAHEISGQPAELRAHVAGGFQAGARTARDRERDQRGSFAVLTGCCAI